MLMVVKERDLCSRCNALILGYPIPLSITWGHWGIYFGVGSNALLENVNIGN